MRAASIALAVPGCVMAPEGPAPRLAEAGGQAGIDPATLLPRDRVGFAHEGSLTTPPCREIVSGRVLAQPITASRAQIACFADPRPDNARPPQALARRFVLRTS